MSVRFTLCDSQERNDCFSKEDTLKWLSRKFIVLLYRQVRFDPSKFFQSTKIRETRLTYIPISSQERQIIPFKLQQTHLKT